MAFGSRGFAVSGFDPEDPLRVVLEDHRAVALIRDGCLDV